MDKTWFRVGDGLRGIGVIRPRAARESGMQREQLFFQPEFETDDIGCGTLAFAELSPPTQ